jgi:hypothetical protein
MDDKLSRRDLFQKSAALGVLVVVGGSACTRTESPGPSCTDTSKLSPSDVQVRTSLAYSDASVDPARTCAACQQFLAEDTAPCGGCKVLRGPISPMGTCRALVARSM